MAWQGRRRGELPNGWNRIRTRILNRDPTCMLRFDCCTLTSTEVDHIGAGSDHRDHMLRGVCPPCHKRRTQDQASVARTQWKRKPEAHPGLR